MFPIDDDKVDKEVKRARDAYEEAVKIARVFYKQMKDQEVDNALLHLIGLELSAMALYGDENPAPEGAKRGAVALYAHRVLDGDMPIYRGHLNEECKICTMVTRFREEDP